jgi:hypothetical protein
MFVGYPQKPLASRYTDYAIPAHIDIEGILEGKSLLFPQFLDHWVWWKGESWGAFLGANT